MIVSIIVFKNYLTVTKPNITQVTEGKMTWFAAFFNLQV
jgi:hypothetical protein